MNVSQKQAILNAIESILSFDFDQFILDNNPSGNVDEIKFGEYSVNEFKAIYSKVFKQLKAELESGLGLMLPNQDVFNNEFGSAILDSESSSFYSYLQNFAQRNDAAEILKRFVFYQIRNGFWNKTTVKLHNVDSEKLNAAQDALILSQKNLTKNLQEFDALKNKLTTQIDDFELVLTKTKEESTNVSTLLEAAVKETDQISVLTISAETENTAIKALATEIKEKLGVITVDITDYEESFTAIKTANKELAEALKKDLLSAKTNLDNSKEGNEFINSQKDNIMKLIGMAADGSLGYKFDKRKIDLEKGINRFWRWAVPLSIIGAAVWVFLIFTTLSANLSNEWVNLIVNIIKTSPAWLLVGFVFSQYGKERHLQEEYAFKSAIAMTLTAYSQMLAEDDGGETNHKSSKQEMLLKSIETIYAQPVSKSDKIEKSELLSPKQLIESLKAISEVAKNIKQ